MHLALRLAAVSHLALRLAAGVGNFAFLFLRWSIKLLIPIELLQRLIDVMWSVQQSGSAADVAPDLVGRALVLASSLPLVDAEFRKDCACHHNKFTIERQSVRPARWSQLFLQRCLLSQFSRVLAAALGVQYRDSCHPLGVGCATAPITACRQAPRDIMVDW